MAEEKTTKKRKPITNDTWNSIAVIPGTVYILVMCFMPVLYLFRYSFTEYRYGTTDLSAFSLSNYMNFFGDSYYVNLLLSSFVMAITVCLITVIIGYPLAYMMVKVKSKLISVIAIVVYLPLMASTVVTSFGWQALLSDSGAINSLLLSIGIIKEPLKLIYNRLGVYIALTQSMLPFMVVSIRNVLATIDPFSQEASKTLGANSVKTFFQVTLPLSLPGISAGIMLVFVGVLSAFVTPSLIGGGRVNTLGSLIYNQVTVAANFPFASAIAFILLICAFALLFINNKILESKKLGGGGR